MDSKDSSSESGISRAAILERRGKRHALFIFATVCSVGLPWAFLLVAAQRHGIVAPKSIASISIDHPEIIHDSATLMAAVIAAAVGICFGTAINTYSRYRLLPTGPGVQLFELEFLSRLNTGRFTMSFQSMPRRWWSLSIIARIASFLAIHAGLTGLFIPSEVHRIYQFQEQELDFSKCGDFFTANTPDPSGGNCVPLTANNFTYLPCAAQQQIPDVLTAGQLAVASFKANIGDDNRLDYSSFDASTSGVLPLGPFGVFSFDTVTWPLQNAILDSHNAVLDLQEALRVNSYTYSVATMQGFSANVNCKTSGAPATTPDGGIDTTCPDNSTPVESTDSSQDASVGDTAGELTAWLCSPSPNNYTLFLYGALDPNDPDNVSAAVCDVTTQYPLLTLDLDDDEAFSIDAASDPPTTFYQPSFDLSGLVMRHVLASVEDSDTNAGNLVTQSISSLDPQSSNAEILATLGSFLQGVAEYEASYIRLIYTGTSITQKQGSACSHALDVEVDVILFGWGATWLTFLLMSPALLVGVIAIVIFIYLFNTPLPAFDPSDFISTVQASSSGGLQFTAETKGTPGHGDETRIIYDNIQGTPDAGFVKIASES